MLEVSAHNRYLENNEMEHVLHSFEKVFGNGKLWAVVQFTGSWRSP